MNNVYANSFITRHQFQNFVLQQAHRAGKPVLAEKGNDIFEHCATRFMRDAFENRGAFDKGSPPQSLVRYLKKFQEYPGPKQTARLDKALSDWISKHGHHVSSRINTPEKRRHFHDLRNTVKASAQLHTAGRFDRPLNLETDAARLKREMLEENLRAVGLL